MTLNYELRTNFWLHVKIFRELGPGARLYDSQNTITITHGSKVIWWWKPEERHQQIKQETQRLAELFGEISKKPEEFLPEKMSPERLVKAFLTYVLKLKLNKQTERYGDRYPYLVEFRPLLFEMDEFSQVPKSDQKYGFDYEILGDASHWHYLYLAPDPKGYAVELDIESAYFTAFLKQPTMLLNDPGVPGQPHFIGDGGAMGRLRDINPELPEWFRLRMLKILGSHELEFYEINPETGLGELTVQTNVINYGMAFNATHKAIYTVYKIMAEVANLIRDDLLRSHTDSFCIRERMSRENEQLMIDALKERGFEVWCKSIGWAHFWDIDRGVLGFGKPKGHIDEIDELRERDGVFVRPTPRAMYQRWEHWLPAIPEWMLESDGQIEFTPRKSIPKVSPEKLAGEWRININGKWQTERVCSLV